MLTLSSRTLWKNSLIGLAVALLVMGCDSYKPSPDGETPTPGPVADAGISLAEGPCFGTCPVYSITVYPNEFYELESKEFTANPGNSTGVLSDGSFAAANAALQAANFDVLPTDVTPGNPACGDQVATDLPPATISEITIAGTRTVNYYPGCINAPDKPALDTLVSSLRSAFGITALVNP